MWISRFAVPVALVLALFFACLAPEEKRLTPTVTAREVLVQAQRAGGWNYTYSQATAAELERAQLARPSEGASREVLEAALVAAGFSLVPVGPPEREVCLVELARG